MREQKVQRRLGRSAAHLPDHPQPGLPGQLSLLQIRADQFAPEIIFSRTASEFYGRLNCLKARHRLRRCHHHRQPPVRPGNHHRSFTAAGWTALCASRQKALLGILNGVDYEEWKTARQSLPDTSLLQRPICAGKKPNKIAFAAGNGLARRRRHPAVRHHLAPGRAKGRGHPIDRARRKCWPPTCSLSFWAAANANTSGPAANLADRYPAKCAVRIGFDTGLSHRIEAGCDFLPDAVAL